MTTGQAPRVDIGTGRGPCARVPCGHAEDPDHVHGHGGWKTHCSICGPDGCPSYKAPGRRKCRRCGVRENVHASFGARLDTGQLVGAAILDGVCPWWMPPPSAPLRALLAVDALLRRFGF